MENFDIKSAPMPWVQQREVPKEQNKDINLDNIDTLYKTTSHESQRTDFEGTFSSISDLTHPGEGFFIDDKTGAQGISFKLQEATRVEDDAKYFYMGVVTGGSIDELDKRVNEEGKIEYSLDNDKNKKFICENLEISEEEYDALACIALALASQETGMGFEEGISLTEAGYQDENTVNKFLGISIPKFEKFIRDTGIKLNNFKERISGGELKASSASSGLTQLKIYDHMQSTDFISHWYNAYLDHLGIEATNSTDDNLYENPDLAAAATMITLTSYLKHHSSYEATMKVYHRNLEEHIGENYGLLPNEALEKGYNYIYDIYEEYQQMNNTDKENIRTTMKQWLLSTNGSTKEKPSEDGPEYTEEVQLEKLNSQLPADKQLTQESLDYIRYFLTDENMTMSAFEYLPYAWNKGLDDVPDRVMADQIGIILSDPEIFNYDQHTTNTMAIAEKYAQQASDGGDGYYILKDILDAYRNPRWYS